MDTATERAIELHKLGNTDQEVRSILERSSGLTPEQVTSVLKNLDKPEERKRTYRLLLIFSIITIVIFTLLTWWFFSTRSFLTLTSTSQPVQSTNLLSGKIVDSTSLPAPLQTLMPNGIQILNESPSVEAPPKERSLLQLAQKQKPELLLSLVVLQKIGLKKVNPRGGYWLQKPRVWR